MGRITDGFKICRMVFFRPLASCQSSRTEHHKSQPEASWFVFYFGGSGRETEKQI